MQSSPWSPMGCLPVRCRKASRRVTHMHSLEPNQSSCFLELLVPATSRAGSFSSTCVSLTVSPGAAKRGEAKCRYLESELHEILSKEALSYLSRYL